MLLTQTNNTIVNLDNIIYIEAEEVETNYKNYIYEITAYYNNNIKVLGQYKTFERANEIIKEIYKQLILQNFSFTYEMPKE